MAKILYPSWVPFADGLAVCSSLVLIRAKYKDYLPLRVHELVHVEQMKRLGSFTFWWRYLTSKEQRKLLEVEAYKVQIKAGTSLAICAGHLANDYYLGISFAEAQILLA